MKEKKQFPWGGVAALTLLDQGIKGRMKRHLGETVPLGRGFSLRPVRNRNLSWGGNYCSLLRRRELLIPANVAALMLIYGRYRGKKGLSRLAATFLFSGCLCSLIDKVLWGGSLDFLRLPQGLIVDLKDCWLGAGVVLTIPQAWMDEKRGNPAVQSTQKMGSDMTK